MKVNKSQAVDALIAILDVIYNDDSVRTIREKLTRLNDGETISQLLFRTPKLDCFSIFSISPHSECSYSIHSTPSAFKSFLIKTTSRT